MRLREYDRSGSDLERLPQELGQGRLRAVATDNNGFTYLTGARLNATSSGFILKFNPAGEEVDRAGMNSGANLSFHDVAIYKTKPGAGVISGQVEKPAFDYQWLLIDFECELEDEALCESDQE